VIQIAQKRVLISFFCAFFLVSTTFANQANTNREILHCNSRENNQNIFKINQSVQFVYKNWDWQLAKDLIDKSVILVQYENFWIIYGFHNAIEPSVLLKIKNSTDKIYICIDKTNKIPYLLISKKNKPIANKEIHFFNFLYQHKNDTYNEYESIKKYFSRILLINLESTSSNSLEELELTVTHEAMHLFGQDNIQFFEPLYKFNKINHEQLIVQNQSQIIEINECELQQSYIDRFSGREYLQYKEKCQFAFKKSVIQEMCLDLNLIDLIVKKNNIKDNESRLHAILLLKEILKEIENRSTIDGEDSFALEWYWYLMEGVPQYMEQRILLEKNQVRLISQYNSYCDQQNGYEEYFYPLLTGAAIWHGLDYVFESADEWVNLASQVVYNIPTNDNSKLWLNNLQKLLDNKINQLNIK